MLLTPESPVIGLSRAQSGIGTLSFTLDADAPDLRLGIVSESTGGQQSVLRRGGTRAPDAPVSISPSGRVTVELHRIRDLARFLVIVTADSPASRWHGAVTATTAAGGRLLLPIESAQPHESCAALSGYRVGEHLVLRAEDDHRDVPRRTVCEAYGYTRLAWRNDRETV